jgi:LemA protein
MKNHNVKDATKLNSEMLNIFGVAEGYPNIKASEQFLNLQNSLVRMESQLQAARRIYNGDVTLYNTKISSFPTNIIAKLFGFTQSDLLEIEEYKKENIKVDFKKA